METLDLFAQIRTSLSNRMCYTFLVIYMAGDKESDSSTYYVQSRFTKFFIINQELFFSIVINDRPYQFGCVSHKMKDF